jgi:hypothetical protein
VDVSESYQVSELQAIDKPTGPVAAAVLATGIGTFVLGLLTTLSEASTSVSDFLKWSEDVGPLSGKTILSVVAFFSSWALLHLLWRHEDRPLRPILITAAVLVVLGIVGTFPTFFEAFAPD